MRKGKLEDIMIEQIEPIYTKDVPHKGLTTRMNRLEEGGVFSNPMVVEKDAEGHYWLIDGHAEYQAYVEWEKATHAPCWVLPLSTRTQHRINVLKKMVATQNKSWLDEDSIKGMFRDEKSVKQMAEQLDLGESHIKYYLIHPDIPGAIIEKAYQNHAHFPHLDQISRLSIPYLLKIYLYDQAVKPTDDHHRLTEENLNQVKWVLSAIEDFEELPLNKQQHLIQLALRYPESWLSFWTEIIKSKIRNYDYAALSYGDYPYLYYTPADFSGHPYSRFPSSGDPRF